MLPTNPPVLIFEIGNLQVFHYPTPEEITFGTAPTAIYWQDKRSKNTYGPFPTIYNAMSHHTWMASVQTGPQGLNANVVYVDFVKKKRIVFSVP